MARKFLTWTNSIFDVHYLGHKKKYQVLQESIDSSLTHKTDLDILDVGSGEKPLVALFAPFAKTYTGVDLNEAMNPDIRASAEHLPLPDDRFDVVFCSQVLEHILDYPKAIQEMWRVLRPGGYVFLTTHGTYPVHGAPHDYWRFTDYGLRKVFQDFSSGVQVLPIGGAVACLLELVNMYFDAFKKFPLVNVLVKAVLAISNVIGWHLDKAVFRPELVINYLVIARK